jgi:chorismate dehydratase
MVVDTPSRLIRSLRSGELDAGLLSSIEAFRHPGYTVLRGLGIASRGPVRSVRAFRRPGLPIRTVGLDASSAAAAALLKILLRRRLGAPDCTFQTVPPTLQPDGLDFDLVLLIGDYGLNADPGERDVLDLGELWHDWTGLPFVYALWLLAPGVDPEAIAPRLHRAREESVRRGVDDGTAGAIHYDLGPRDLQGLQRYHQEALDLGLAEPGITPEYFGRFAPTEPDSVSEGDSVSTGEAP